MKVAELCFSRVAYQLEYLPANMSWIYNVDDRGSLKLIL